VFEISGAGSREGFTPEDAVPKIYEFLKIVQIKWKYYQIMPCPVDTQAASRIPFLNT
jgi:hypothetical protein